MRIEIPTERTRPRCYDRPPASRLRDVYGVDQATGRTTKTTIDDGWASPGCRWLPEGETP